VTALILALVAANYLLIGLVAASATLRALPSRARWGFAEAFLGPLLIGWPLLLLMVAVVGPLAAALAALDWVAGRHARRAVNWALNYEAFYE
jgi:hypothetical protein